jgi:fengycin family lipopeptide synthetase D
MIIALLATLKTGAAFVPIDPNHPKAIKKDILEDANVKVLLTDSVFIFDIIEYYSGALFTLDNDLSNVKIDGENSTMSKEVSDHVYAIYTSGTTGKPKGVLVRHASLYNYVNWFNSNFNIGRDDATVLLSSFAFDLGYTSLWSSLTTGATLHIVDEKVIKDPDLLVSYLMNNNITYVKLTPSLFYLVLYSSTEKVKRLGVRLFVLGGEEIRINDIVNYNKLNAKATFVNHYGPTETTIGCIAHQLDMEKLSEYKNDIVIGRPIDNAAAYILDVNFNVSPRGVEGDLYISGKGMAEGYLNNAAMTSEKFFFHPLINERLYRTGDRAKFLESGNVAFLGRNDKQIKIRGYRVEMQAVESAVLHYGGVENVIVLPRENKEKIKELVCCFTSKQTIDVIRLKDYLHTILPDYSIPSGIIQLQKFPLTPNGKIDQKQLLQLAEKKSDRLTHSIEPKNAFEIELLSLWREVLEKENISTNDNFFNLGGDSLKIVKLLFLLQEKYATSLAIADLFDNPTLSTQAALISAALQHDNVRVSEHQVIDF